MEAGGKCVSSSTAPINEHSHYEKNNQLDDGFDSQDWFEDFSRFVHTKGLAPRSVQSYLGWVRQLDQHFPDQYTPDLTSRQVLDFFVHLQTERTLAGATVNQAVCAVRCLFRDHLQINWDIWSQVKIKRANTLPSVLAREETALLLETFHSGLYRAFFTLVYHCGLRLGEALALRPTDLNSARKVVRIRKAKGGKTREVPISDELLERLNTYYQFHKNPRWLFPGLGRGWKSSGMTRRQALAGGKNALTRATVWAAFNAAKLESGLSKKHPELRVHTLRHSYATHLLDAGVSLRQVSANLGHASLQPTLIYLHLTEVSEAKTREALRSLPIPPRNKNS